MRTTASSQGTNSFFVPLNDREADPEIEELQAFVEADWWGLFRRSTRDWYRGRIVGASHTQFSDFPLADPGRSDAAIAPQRVMGHHERLAAGVLRQVLKHVDHASILSAQNPYPELRMVSEKSAEP